MTGVEPAGSCLQGKRTTTRATPAWCPVQDSNPIRKIRSLATVLRTGHGARTGNRTPVACLRNKCSTTELFRHGTHRRSRTRNPACDKQAGGYRPPKVGEQDGARGGDRTPEWMRVKHLPYHLATRAWRSREGSNLILAYRCLSRTGLAQPEYDSKIDGSVSTLFAIVLLWLILPSS